MRPQSVHGNDSPGPFPKGLWPFIKVTVQWGRRNTQVLQRLLEIWFELTLIPGDLKHYHGTGAYENHVTNGILGPLNPVSISGHFPHLQMSNGMNIFGSWQNLEIGFWVKINGSL